MKIMKSSIIFLFVAIFVFPGCATVNTHHPDTVHAPQQGPPAHAPAHGYRKKHRHDNVELVWDSGKGVYVVIAHEGHFFSKDVYYRIAGDHWEVSGGINGPWKVTNSGNVPPGLRKHHHGKSKGKGKGKKKGYKKY